MAQASVMEHLWKTYRKPINIHIYIYIRITIESPFLEGFPVESLWKTYKSNGKPVKSMEHLWNTYKNL